MIQPAMVQEKTLPESLLQRIAQSPPSSPDEAAVRECIDRYSGLVWSLARRFSASDADAEDAVQEIFINLWRSAGRFDPAVASEPTFISMIARRRLIDRNRARARRISAEPLADDGEPLGSPSAASSLQSPVETADEAARAARALGTLSPEQQRVLRLSVYQGLSHEQIAQATGIPLGTVKTHIRRGLIRIRDLLEGAAAPGQTGRASA